MRHAPLILPVAATLAATAMTGCAATPPPPVNEAGGGAAVVHVTALYRERIILPPGHVLNIRVEDVTLADAPSRIMAQATEPLSGPPPYRLTLAFSAAEMAPRRAYAARAEILDPSGRLAFAADTRHAVLAKGAVDHVEIVMKSVR